MWELNNNVEVNIVSGGSVVRTVSAGENFVSVVQDVAGELGMNSFKVYVTRGGVESEVQAGQAPANFEGLERVRIERYNKAG